MGEVTIDADGHVLGRLATHVAERLKDGDTVHVVNAERAVISGDPENTYKKYRARHERGNREHGPRFPKAPDRILKRTVRGMLPDTSDGREALKRLRTYRGNPEDRDAETVEVRRIDDLSRREAVTLQDVSDNM